jgi:hypothetical protein
MKRVLSPTAFARMQQERDRRAAETRGQEEAHWARLIQAQVPDTTRDEALRAAERIVTRRRGA